MGERKIKHLFIGTLYENKNNYIERINLNMNIQKELINDFLSKEIIKNYVINDNNIGFCLNCKNNVNSKNISKCDKHQIKYFKDLINNINIEQIKNNMKIIIDNYNYIINIIEEKIKNFKERNDNQILLAKKIIDIYKSCLKSDNLTYQTILNTKNILQFNEINKDNFREENKPINFGFNILKTFSMDKYIDKKNQLTKFTKIQNIF